MTAKPPGGPGDRHRGRPGGWRGRGLACAVALVASACATRGALPDTPATQAQVGFVRTAMTRAEVESRLGRPWAAYENGRVVSYVVYPALEGPRVPWPGGGRDGRFELLLEYDAAGQVRRYAWVQLP